jgi:CRP/FNR family transcriptional regulator, cyclic AMP receptor protein
VSAANDREDLLGQVPLFAGISAPGIEQLGAIADEVEVRAGTVLTQQGHREGFFFIVLEGTVRIERDGRTVNILGPGDYLGEIALLDGGPRTATVAADTDVRLLGLTEWMFRGLLAEHPSIALKTLESVAGRLRAVATARV